MTSLIQKLRHWRNTSVARGRLARLDDRMLRDIGMVRGDIDRATRGLS
jgi:uncharacterized protein YjiS (DUF1127 family)